MRETKGDQQLLGFVVRDEGISFHAWQAYAEADQRLEKKPPRPGINPFTGKAMLYKSNSYYVRFDRTVVGCVAWEESECIGVYGLEEDMKPYISILCAEFSGVFEQISQ